MADATEPTPVCSTPSHDGRPTTQLSLPGRTHSRSSSHQTEESSFSQATAAPVSTTACTDESDSGSDEDDTVAPENRDMQRFWTTTRQTWDDLAPGQQKFIQAVVAAVRSMPVSGAVLHVQAASKSSHLRTEPAVRLPTIQLAASSQRGKTVTGHDFAHPKFWHHVKHEQSETLNWRAMRQQQTAGIVFGGNTSPCAPYGHQPSRRQAHHSLSRRGEQFECSVSLTTNLNLQLLSLA
jgi:hypothetical protein